MSILRTLTFIFFIYAVNGLAFSETKIDYRSETGYRLLVNGEDFKVKGVAGERYLDILKAYGGNTIRTWSIDKEILDAAHEKGLKVVAGIWIEHMRHGYDYNNKRFIKKQRKEVEAIVRKFRDHPALLAWGLGNEVEIHISDEMIEPIWQEMNTLAKIVKSVDPNHPIMTAVAGFNAQKLEQISRFYPEIDILGVNAYGFSHKVGDLLREYQWAKPYMITEFGPIGPWEVGDTKMEWGATLEETSHEKAKRYQTAHHNAMNEQPLYCLGTFPFFWGHKQETTTTWFGMFLPNGARLEAVDVMAKAWYGRYPTNRVPEIHAIESSAKYKKVSKGSMHQASIKVIDHENDALTYNWVIMEESKVKSVGGDYEKTPKSFPKLILEAKGSKVNFKAPRKKGAYRLFAYVEDSNRGAATANFPFYVD